MLKGWKDSGREPAFFRYVDRSFRNQSVGRIFPAAIAGNFNTEIQ